VALVTRAILLNGHALMRTDDQLLMVT